MDRQYHVSPRLLLNVVQEGSELVFASSRLYVPRRFSFANYDDMLHVAAYTSGRYPSIAGGKPPEAAGPSTRHVNRPCPHSAARTALAVLKPILGGGRFPPSQSLGHP